MAKAFFKENRNGYDKEQVDNYINKLIREYQKIYRYYLDAHDKYCKLDCIKKKREIISISI